MYVSIYVHGVHYCIVKSQRALGHKMVVKLKLEFWELQFLLMVPAGCILTPDFCHLVKFCVSLFPIEYTVVLESMNVVNSLPPMRGSSVPPTRDLSVEPLSLLNVLHSEPTSITLSEENKSLQLGT